MHYDNYFEKLFKAFNLDFYYENDVNNELYLKSSVKSDFHSICFVVCGSLVNKNICIRRFSQSIYIFPLYKVNTTPNEMPNLFTQIYIFRFCFFVAWVKLLSGQQQNCFWMLKWNVNNVETWCNVSLC